MPDPMFRGDLSFLSNFYPAKVMICGKLYSTTEHYYQAMKCDLEEDGERIRLAPTPGQAKRLGRKVRLRPDWEEIKVDIMRMAIEAKFGQNPDLATRLRETGNLELVETNYWHDNFWGSCFCKRCNARKGRNILGRLLMEVRELPLSS